MKNWELILCILTTKAVAKYDCLHSLFLLSGISYERFCLYCNSQRRMHPTASWTWKVFWKNKMHMFWPLPPVSAKIGTPNFKPLRSIKNLILSFMLQLLLLLRIHPRRKKLLKGILIIEQRGSWIASLSTCTAVESIPHLL